MLNDYVRKLVFGNALQNSSFNVETNFKKKLLSTVITETPGFYSKFIGINIQTVNSNLSLRLPLKKFVIIQVFFLICVSLITEFVSFVLIQMIGDYYF